MDSSSETPAPDLVAMLRTMLNLTASHREHEKFYSVSPREQAVTLQRHSRTLHALAERWLTTDAAQPETSNPYAGAVDLNADAAVQLDGVLFMEGQGEPGEIQHLKRELRSLAEDSTAAGAWLTEAMGASWGLAPALFGIDDLADLLGERHRIIANNWQGAAMLSLTGNILVRAAELLDAVDFTPAALRADLRTRHVSAHRVQSAAEMLDHAADLLSDYGGLVHDNERRWRVFHTRVETVLDDAVSGDRTGRGS